MLNAIKLLRQAHKILQPIYNPPIADNDDADRAREAAAWITQAITELETR